MGFFGTVAALGAAGPLASRAFLPLLAVLLLARFPQAMTWLGATPPRVPEALSFMSSTWFLVVVAALALAELFADKNSDVKEAYDLTMTYVKAGVAVLVALAVVPGEATRVVPEVKTSGLGGALAVGFGVGLLTWWLGRLRARFFDALRELDDEDHLGVQKMISLLEDLWSVCGVVLVIVLPILALVLTGLLLAAVVLVRRLLELRENAQREACPHCGHGVLPTALRCKQCHGHLEPTELLGWRLWGAPPPAPVPLPEETSRAHTLRLISRRRCPACGEKGEVIQVIREGCSLCAAPPLGQSYPGWFEDYQKATIRRGWLMMIPVLAASFLPVVGFAVAVVVTKVVVVSPLRVFLGRGQRFALRWGLRLVTLLLLIPANLPVVSILSAPCILVFTVLAYGHAARRAARELDSAAVS
jgi:hypothetical protein